MGRARPRTLLIAVILLAAGLGGALVAPRVRGAIARRRQVPIRTTAEELTRAYSDRPLEAAMKYGGRLLDPSGHCSGFDEGIIGDGAVHLAGSAGRNVLCLFDATTPLAQIGNANRAGKAIRVSGFCNGTDEDGELQVGHCQLLGP